MLTLSRKKNSAIHVGGSVVLKVVNVSSASTCFVLEYPSNMWVLEQSSSEQNTLRANFQKAHGAENPNITSQFFLKKVNDIVQLGNDIVFKIVSICCGDVKIGIEAPRTMRISREDNLPLPKPN